MNESIYLSSVETYGLGDKTVKGSSMQSGWRNVDIAGFGIFPSFDANLWDNLILCDFFVVRIQKFLVFFPFWLFSSSYPSCPLSSPSFFLPHSVPFFLYFLLILSPCLPPLSSPLPSPHLDYGWKKKCQGCSWQLHPDQLRCTPTRYKHTHTHTHMHSHLFSLCLVLLHHEKTGLVSHVLYSLLWFLVLQHFSSKTMYGLCTWS